MPDQKSATGSTPAVSPELIRQLETIEVEALRAIYQSASPEAGEQAGLSLVEDDGAIGTFAAKCDVLGLNRIVGLGLGREDPAETLERLMEPFHKTGVERMFVQLNPIAQTDSLLKRLDQLRFTHYNNWVKLYCDLKPLEGIRSDLRIDNISNRYAEDFARIVTESFDWPANLRPWLADLARSDEWHHFLAMDNDTPAATGSIFVSGNMVWADFAATAEAYRGRGAQSALMKKRFEIALSRGCTRVVVETAQQTAEKQAPSYRNMIRFGFKEVYVRPNYILTR